MIQLKEAFFGAFSPDSSFFAAVGKASRVLLYNENGEQSRFATIPFASAISVSTDSKKLALASPEHKLCIAKIDGDLIAIRKTEAEASDSLWTPDSSRILIPYWNKELHLLNAESGEIEAVKEIGKSPRLQLGPGGFALTHWRIDEYLHPRIETFDWKLEAISEPIELSTEYSRFGVSQGFNYFWGIGQSGLEVLDTDQKSLFKHPGDVRSAAISPRES